MRPLPYRTIIGLLLFLAGILNYLDRAALGVVAPLLQKDLTLSPSVLGVIFSTFFIGYSLFAFVGGQLADRYGPRRVYIWAAAGWSVLSALTGLATGFVTLFIVRFLFGFAEGPMNSTTNRTITNWFTREETSRTVGFTFSGQTVGSAVCAPLVGFLAYQYGWRWAFFVTGGLGVIWVIAWAALATDLPSQNKRVGAAELEQVRASRAASAIPPSEQLPNLRAYLMQPSTLALGLGMFAVNYVLYIFISWLPSYLTNALHMDIKQMAIVAAIPWLFGFVGYVGGGIIADYAYRRMPDRLAARKLTTIAPLALAAVALIGVNFAESRFAAVALIAVSVMLLTSSVQSCWATIHELVPEGRVGSVSGFIHLLSNLSGIIGPTATGLAVQYLGGYSSAFVIAAVISLAGVVAMTLFVKRPGASPAFAGVAAARPHG